ncbi:MAG: nuclear transport factor 2 family protein [Ignavibacteriales bacterium]|nr:nuclear transport factor 2 family protein [Ignavibacteriales bacterium]
MDKTEREVRSTMAAINRAWRENRPLDMKPHIHHDVAMALPGYSGSIAGRDTLIGSFVEFCTNARVLEYREHDEQVQIIGDAAFVSFQFEMVYERAAYRERSKGRDVWAFRRVGGKWIAIWRTMVDIKAERSQTV